MSVAEIKKELHKAIDEIENEELLQAMLTILSQTATYPKNINLLSSSCKS